MNKFAWKHCPSCGKFNYPVRLRLHRWVGCPAERHLPALHMPHVKYDPTILYVCEHCHAEYEQMVSYRTYSAVRKFLRADEREVPSDERYETLQVGALWYNETENKVEMWDGSQIIQVDMV